LPGKQFDPVPHAQFPLAEQLSDVVAPQSMHVPLTGPQCGKVWAQKSPQQPVGHDVASQMQLDGAPAIIAR
jgi:hypothetical protein